MHAFLDQSSLRIIHVHALAGCPNIFIASCRCFLSESKLGWLCLQKRIGRKSEGLSESKGIVQPETMVPQQILIGHIAMNQINKLCYLCEQIQTILVTYVISNYNVDELYRRKIALA